MTIVLWEFLPVGFPQNNPNNPAYQKKNQIQSQVLHRWAYLLGNVLRPTRLSPCQSGRPDIKIGGISTAY